MAHGRFITFEGGEGAGKSTQVAGLAQRLGDFGVPVVVTREPGGTVGAEAVREVLLSGGARPFGARGEAVLFAAARIDHIDRVIRPALSEGRWVICDRFMDSTRAYQGADGVEAPLLDALDEVALDGLKPDLTFLIDLPPRIGLARVQGRAGRRDRFEADALARHQRRRQIFQEIARKEPRRFVRINGAQPADNIAERVWQKTVRQLGSATARVGA